MPGSRLYKAIVCVHLPFAMFLINNTNAKEVASICIYRAARVTNIANIKFCAWVVLQQHD